MKLSSYFGNIIVGNLKTFPTKIIFYAFVVNEKSYNKLLEEENSHKVGKMIIFPTAKM